MRSPTGSRRPHVEVIRDFNRYYTRRIGVLTDRYLGQDRPLAEARLLFEIGEHGAVRDLRARLGLDTGYLSRLLRSLEQQGLVRVTAAPDDGRARVAELTDAGRQELVDLDRRSADGIAGLLAPLTVGQREQLVASVQQMHRLLRLAGVQLALVDAGSAVARQCLLKYAEELEIRFPEGYARSALVAPEDLHGDGGGFLVALEEDRPVGCGAWRRLRPGVAEVRHLWVHQDTRGLGIGRRLLQRIEADAAAHAVTTVRLGTHSVLVEAITLYSSSGYHPIPTFDNSPYNHLAFEKALTTTTADPAAPQ